MKRLLKTRTAVFVVAAVSAVTLVGCATQPTTSPVTEAPAAEEITVTQISSASGVHEYKLNNGLKIIVKEDHRAPVVVSQIWYKVGSSYEYGGITGASHVLEHMMFKGTTQYGPNEFSRIIAANGGRENAFTGQDYTAYFQQLEKSRLAISFELEADRMQNLLLNPEEIKKEVLVVMEERRMRTEDKPRSLTYEQFKATAFVTSPYHNPIIGWMDDLENLTIDDLQQWYQHWYAPNNATLVVAGDVDPQQVVELAKKHFGPVKSRPVPKVKPQREIEQRGIRRITVKAPAQLPFLIMGYKTPVINTAETDWEPYAIDMLAGVLDGGESARFTRNLVRGQQIAASVGAGYDLHSRLGGMLVISGTPSKDVGIEELEKAIRVEIDRFKTELVTQGELDRIKAQVLAAKVYEKDSIFYQAMQIGTLETVGLDWRLMDEYMDRLKAVTPEQIRAVANKYLSEDRLTVAVLEPQAMTSTPPPAAHGGQHAH
ncbi:MAG: insulinase family protein [Gammaproteobacteria bacterium]|nr:insulinase family protein [Gammaproteobacteria bacterium]MCF6364339.1 insulinase family protein [Gammaproteobacteria bacterium]